MSRIPQFGTLFNARVPAPDNGRRYRENEVKEKIGSIVSSVASEVSDDIFIGCSIEEKRLYFSTGEGEQPIDSQLYEHLQTICRDVKRPMQQGYGGQINVINDHPHQDLANQTVYRVSLNANKTIDFKHTTGTDEIPEKFDFNMFDHMHHFTQVQRGEEIPLGEGPYGKGFPKTIAGGGGRVVRSGKPQS